MSNRKVVHVGDLEIGDNVERRGFVTGVLRGPDGTYVTWNTGKQNRFDNRFTVTRLQEEGV